MKRKPSHEAKSVEALDKNYAENKEFAATLCTNIMEIFRRVKSDREGKEEIWQRSYRSWSIDSTGADKNYDGMADLKVPQLRKEVETMSRRIYKGLLPEDYLKGEPAEGIGSQELVLTNTQVVRHYLDNIIQVKKIFMPWIKQNVLLGSSPIRSFWHKKENDMFYRKRVGYADKNGVIRYRSNQVKERVILYNGPKLRTEDLFKTWVYPSTATNAEDIEMTFWETTVKRSDLEWKSENGMCAHFAEIKEMGTDLVHEEEESLERLAQFGDTGERAALQGNNFFKLLEVWCDLVLPGDNLPSPCVVEIINGSFCTRIQRNPYWHQQAPFDWARFIIPPPGEFYGRGLPEAAMSLQHQLDDTMNQTMDAATLALNNITIINPAYAPNDESFEIEPGAKWWADPNAVKQFQFPDLSDTGYKAANIIKSWISELSDNQPQLPDPIAGKARSTGQAQLAVNEWQTDLFTFIDFLSIEALNPLAMKIHSLIQQNISDDDVIRIAGRYAGTWMEKLVEPHDIVGRYKFKWIGALQIENQAMKTQQLMNLLNIWRNLPPDAQQQIRPRWQNLMIKIFRDGFLIKDVENILETDRMSSSVKPDLEEKIFELGGDLTIHESDDDMAHVAWHERQLALDRDPVKRAQRIKHIQEHKDQSRKKAEAKMMMQQMMQMQQQPPQGRREGNTTQIPEGTDQSNLERGMRAGGNY